MARKSRIAAQLNIHGTIPVTLPEPETPKFKTGIYARLSIKDLGIEDGDTMETQIALLQDYVEHQKDMVLQEIYVDNGWTGTNFQRPEFNRLLEDVKEGKVNCILVKDLSRFGRNYLEAGYYLQTLFPSYGVRFIALYDSYDSLTSDPDSLSVVMKNIVNDYYSKDISRKISATIDLKRTQGPHYAGTIPYGYKMNRSEPKRYLKDKKVAAFVQLIFHWAMEGLSPAQIARNLNDLQIPSPQAHFYQNRKSKKTEKAPPATLWTFSTVSGILSNPVYTGNYYCNKSYFRKYDPANSGYVPEEEWICYPNVHESYISHEDFANLKRKREEDDRLREDNRKKQTLIPSSSNLFKGLVYCGECGKKLSFQTNKNNFKFSTFSCSGKASKVLNSHARLSITYGAIESIVLYNLQAQLRLAIEADSFLNRLSMEEARKRLKARRQAELQMFYSKLSAITSRKQQAFEDMSAGLLEPPIYRMQIEKLEQERLWLEEDKKNAQKRLGEVDTYFTPDNEWLRAFLSANISEELNTPAVRLLIKRIDIWNDRQICITFHFSDWMEKLNNCIAELKMIEMEELNES